MQKRLLGAHWLTFLGLLKQGDGIELLKAAIVSKALGFDLFELICNDLNQMPSGETKGALVEAGVEQVAYTRFFGGDSGCNPILKDDDKSYKAIMGDLSTITALKEKGIGCDWIVGPSCFQIGLDYSKMSEDEFIKAAIAFYAKIRPLCENAGVRIALEYLRDGEDCGALMGLDRLRKICESDECAGFVFWHADRFHMQMREKDPVAELTAGADLLKYFHCHGTDRLPPGHEDDKTDWIEIARILGEINYSGPMVCEPFGEPIRKLAPQLGEGLPKAMHPWEYLKKAFNGLTVAGAV